MASKEMGTDQMFVLPTAEIAILGAAPAVDILDRKEIEQADDTEAFRQSKMREYRDTFGTPYHSASRMLVVRPLNPRPPGPGLLRPWMISFIPVNSNFSVGARRKGSHGLEIMKRLFKY
jgi:hypothetical protein